MFDVTMFDVMDERRIRELSYHEAGHPVAHCLLRTEFKCVHLRDSPHWTTMYEGDKREPPTNREELESRMIDALAGDVAAGLFVENPTPSVQDVGNIESLLDRLNAAEDAEAFTASMRGKTLELLDTPANRRAIKALADHFYAIAPRVGDDPPGRDVSHDVCVAIIDDALDRDSP